jgi:hypothetical protein
MEVSKQSHEKYEMRKKELFYIKRLLVTLFLLWSVVFALLSEAGANPPQLDYFFDETRGFLRNRIFHIDQNNHSFFNPNNILDIEEWEDEITGNLIIGKRLERTKFRADGEVVAIFDSTHETDAWMNELFVSHVFPSYNIFVAIGRQKVSWGSGLFVNPSETFRPSRNPFDPSEDRKGIDSLRFSWTRSILQLQYFLEYGDHLEDDWRHHGKIGITQYNTDLAVTYTTKADKAPVMGLQVSRYLTDDLEIHVEGVMQEGRDNPVAEAIFPGIARFEFKDDDEWFFNCVVGLRHFTGEHDLTTIVEYYFNGDGYSESEFDSLHDEMRRIGMTVAPSPFDLAFLQTASDLVDKPYLRRNYLFLSSHKGFRLSTLNIGLDVLISIDDGSGRLGPSIDYLVRENLQFKIQGGFAFGKNNSEFGSLPADSTCYFETKLLF